MLKLYEEDNQSLRSENAQLTSELGTALDEADRLRRECEGLKHHLNRRVEVAEAPVEAQPRQFDDWSMVIEAVENEFAERLVLTNRARKAIKDSPFTGYSQAFDAFEILHQHFHPWFLGQRNMESVDAVLQEYGIEVRGAHERCDDGVVR